jgi:hypothetical protein
MPLPPLKLMGQSRRGVVLEVQVHPLIAVIPRFIQLEVPLSPLKPTAQFLTNARVSRRNAGRPRKKIDEQMTL